MLGDSPDLIEGLAASGVDAARRALRLPVRELEGSLDERRMTPSFWLPAGAFATSVLRERMTWDTLAPAAG